MTEEELQQRIRELTAERTVLQQQLWQIMGSESYKLNVKIFKVIDTFFPKGSCRRNCLERAYYAVKRAYKRLRNRGGSYDSSEDIAALALADESRSIKTFKMLATPVCENPIVSIIIPAYNQFKYTYCCIRSVIENSGDVPYEIILADDCSTDETINAVNYIKNVRVVRASQNIRFLKNCNNAARYAKGKYILFLNNDTLVHSNWLRPLVDLCEGDETIGVTGSKLVYSDGTLQEAGGIVWQDGSAWNFGHGRNPLDSEFCYVKECDYISGAALMVRKSLWNEVGGFDEAFAPAYYEDTDFCFETRKHGYRVVFQPRSIVTHFEGRSNGTNLASGIKKHQIENQRKFYEKWMSVLSEHAPNGVDAFTARDRSLKKQHIFLVDHYIPTFDKDAGGRQIYFYLKTLSGMGFQLHLLGDDCTHEEPYTSTFQQMGIEVLYGCRFYPMNREHWFRENGRFLDFAFLHRPHIAVNYVGLIRSTTKAKIIFFGADVGQVRVKREYDLKKTSELLVELDVVKKQEDFLYETSDVNLCVGSGDASFVAEHYPTRPVFDIPLFIYDKFREEAPPFGQRSDVMFVGGFNHHANVDGVLWFVKEIWPLILKACPDIKFHIVGSKVPKEIRSLASESIVVEGFMPDQALWDLYDKCRLTVAPLRYGAGVKGKIIDAMYFRSVVVTTSIGAEGIPQNPKPFPVVDEAKLFAAEVIRLYQDESLWQSYQKASLEVIKKTYSLEVARKLLAEIFVKG